MGDELETPQRARILVVDDDPVFCSILEEWLGTEYDVIVAHDGEEALRMAATGRPAAIILDVMLPKLSGAGVAWVLRHDARYRRTPVIFVSGHGSMAQEAAGKPSETDAFMLKPVSLEYLSTFLRQHIPEAMEELGLAVPSQAERRASPRVEVRLAARVVADEADIEGTVLSLSPFGAYVQCELEVPPMTKVAIDLSDGGLRLAQRGSVAYSALRGGQRGIGLQFDALAGDNERVLLAILTRHAPKS